MFNFGDNFKLSRFSRKSVGFSLMEMLVTMGIAAGLSMVILRLSDNSTKSVVKLETETDITMLFNEVNSMLADPVRCKLTFNPDPSQPLTLKEDVLPEINPVSIVNTYTKNNKEYLGATSKFLQKDEGDAPSKGYGESRIKISSYELKTDSSNDVLEIKFNVRKSAKSTGGDVVRKINMFVDWDESTDGNKYMRTCRALSASTPTIWSRSETGDGGAIFYRGGNVGIGVVDPSTDLHVSGNIKADKVVAKTFFYSSDRRLKKNIKTIKDPVAKIKLLRGVIFDWKKDHRKDYGFIAQEVNSTIPELVHKASFEDYYSVDYAKVVPILVEAVRKQQDEINILKKEIEEIER